MIEVLFWLAVLWAVVSVGGAFLWVLYLLARVVIAEMFAWPPRRQR